MYKIFLQGNNTFRRNLKKGLLSMKEKDTKNNRFDVLKSIIGGKGYYLALLVCALIVGITTYMSVKNSIDISEPDSYDDYTQINEEEEPISQTGDTVLGITVPKEETDTPENDVNLPADDTDTEEAETTAAKTEKKPETEKPKKSPVYYMMPVEGEIVKDYSQGVLVFSNTMKDYRAHMGIDIAGPVGAPVKACADGEVIEIIDDELMGKTVVIKHTNNVISRYSNLSPDLAAGIEVGKSVKCGDTIGCIGQTAIIEISEPTHLHFELTKDGEYLDPIKEIKGG